MTRDLLTQLAEYGTDCDARQGVVSADDITEAVMPLPMPAQLTRPRRGWLISAASAAVLLILVGGVAWLVPSGGGAPPATELTVATTMTATEEAVELAVLGLTIGPEPQFDTSALGSEVVFERSEDEDLSAQVSQLIFDNLPPGYEYPIPMDLESLEGRLVALITDPDAANPATLTGPIQYVGHVPDTGEHLIAWETNDGVGLSVLSDGGLTGAALSCCGGASEDYGMWLGAGSDSTTVIVVAVPPETSVVGITEPDGNALWQRPIGGWGMFEVAHWPEGSPGPTIDAYDDLGNQIGNWTSGSQTAVSTTTPTTVAIAPASRDTFDRLGDALAQAPVYHPIGFEVTAEVEYLDAYIEGLAGTSVWPEPEFDTSTLGTESVLIELPPFALTSVPRTIPFYSEDDDQPVIEQPLVAGAQLSGTKHAATFFVGIGFKDGDVALIWRLLYTQSYTQGTVFEEDGGMQWREIDDQDPPHIILMTGDGSEDSPTIIGGLPPEASVVTTTLENGTKVWQRPISGIAIFSVRSHRCVSPDGPPTCSTEFIVLNANGNEILRLASADADLHPLGFTVTGP